MKSRCQSTSWISARLAVVAWGMACLLIMGLSIISCEKPQTSMGPAASSHGPSNPYVADLGNLRGNKAPSQTETKIAEFLFGAEPESSLGLIKPTSIAVAAGAMFVCDPAQSAVFRYDWATGEMKPFQAGSGLQRPNSVSSAGNGEWLIGDVAIAAVVRVDEQGAEKQRYSVSGSAFRPADAIRVNDEVWASNTPLHRIEVFDFETGVHQRPIGERGSAPGQFGFPLGMAVGADGRVYVADSLNHRVQVLDADGTPRGTIGKPGDRVGSFGRPKDVAVGPDGTVFVVDAASQRVHVFDRLGRSITAFGEPRGGMSELCIPSGIEISTCYSGDQGTLPSGFTPDLFVFVTEQLRAPGVRVFGWRGPSGGVRPTFPPRAMAAGSQLVASVPNPHWVADRCTSCHETAGEKMAAIDPSNVDRKCLECHDGVKAHAEAHPIGRSGHTAFANVPQDWPLNQERLSCITCHDIQRHCDSNAARPDRNAAMLRGREVESRLDFCTNCHTPSEKWRINPHRQLADDGSLRTDACGFCHSTGMERIADGQRTHQPMLRATGSAICLSCHAPHWDYFPEGHVERPATDEIRRRLIAREFAPPRTSGPSQDNAAFLAAINDPNHQTSVLPLADNKVACYSCHNPHAPGLFPADSPLGRFAQEKDDAKILLRGDRFDLCQTCHSK